jgi:beta-phosphoglucomutase family hydrolase
MSRGFIFDMNGTMVDDMAFHQQAWGNVINGKLNANLTDEQLKLEMYGKNEEVLERIFGKGRFTAAEMHEIAMGKEDAYQEAFRPHLKLIDGLQTFLDRAKEEHIPMAIGTAAIPHNLDFVLDNLHLRHYFSAIVSANDVKESKPHPETFLLGATGMNVRPEDCVVFEDAPKGVEAALNAGMKAVAVTTVHEAADFARYSNVLFCISDYNDPRLNELFATQN